MRDTFNREDWKPVAIAPAALARTAKKAGVQVIDQLPEQLEELFLLRHPQYRFDKNYQAPLQAFLKKELPRLEKRGWFYFSWSQLLVHYLPETMHFELRTGRNRNLITAEEQKKYYDACVGILGMSVGSHVALTIAMTGGAKYIKLADPDTISGSNLNRIRSGFSALGVKKTFAVARQIVEINPYAKIELYKDGISEKNMATFLGGKRKLTLLVEEMDNPFLKLSIRPLAREAGIPVIMAADNGDGVIVDVERYDLDRSYPILHGLAKDIPMEGLKAVKPEDLPKIIAKIAGAEHAVARMLASVKEVGKTLYSWPQLGTAATMCGSVLAYLARKIITGETPIASGRSVVSPESIFEKK